MFFQKQPSKEDTEIIKSEPEPNTFLQFSSEVLSSSMTFGTGFSSIPKKISKLNEIQWAEKIYYCTQNVGDAIRSMASSELSFFSVVEGLTSSQQNNTNSAIHFASKVNFFSLPIEVLTMVANLLDAKTLCKVLAINKEGFRFVQANDYSLWSEHITREFNSCFDENNCRTAREMFVKYILVRADFNYAHYLSLKEMHQSLYNFRTSFPGICTPLCDFGYVKGEKMAKVLSLKRNYAMGTLLVQRSRDILSFKKKFNQTRPQNFLPLDACAENFTSESVLDKLPQIQFPGFIDYAVNIIQLRPQHEKYRYSALFTLFKDLMVFETLLDVDQFTFTFARRPYAVALDQFSEEELNAPGPKFSWFGFRANVADMKPESTGIKLHTELENAKLSLANLRYNPLFF